MERRPSSAPSFTDRNKKQTRMGSGLGPTRGSGMVQGGVQGWGGVCGSVHMCSIRCESLKRDLLSRGAAAEALWSREDICILPGSPGVVVMATCSRAEGAGALTLEPGQTTGRCQVSAPQSGPVSRRSTIDRTASRPQVDQRDQEGSLHVPERTVPLQVIQHRR